MSSKLVDSRDVEGIFRKGTAAIPFTGDENSIGLSWLRSKGWRDGEPFVCLHVRDSAFTARDPSANHFLKHAPDAWAYNDYRNSDISTYVESIRWLTGRGVWVLRMGRIVEKPASFENPRFIDYAIDAHQSDLLDIWLFAHSSAVISTQSGLDVLAQLYRVPTLIVNVLPVAQIWNWCSVVSAPKTLRESKTGRTLSLSEHVLADFYTESAYRSAGLEWVDHTPQELLDYVRRFWSYVEGTYEYDVSSQGSFWRLLTDLTGGRYHNYSHPLALVEPSWLVKIERESSKSSQR